MSSKPVFAWRFLHRMTDADATANNLNVNDTSLHPALSCSIGFTSMGHFMQLYPVRAQSLFQAPIPVQEVQEGIIFTTQYGAKVLPPYSTWWILPQNTRKKPTTQIRNRKTERNKQPANIIEMKWSLLIRHVIAYLFSKQFQDVVVLL